MNGLKADYTYTEKSSLAFYIIGAVISGLVALALLVGEIVIITDEYGRGEYVVSAVVMGLFLFAVVLALIVFIRFAVVRNNMIHIETMGRRALGRVEERKIDMSTNQETGQATFSPYIWYSYVGDSGIRKVCKERVELAQYNMIDAVCKSGNLNIPVIILGDRAVLDIKSITG
ncbi:MAG: hypothetical protein IJ861_09180 [Clostridia bacterium]|nr:hypothetical protein [Clostridia bacterium]